MKVKECKTQQFTDTGKLSARIKDVFINLVTLFHITYHCKSNPVRFRHTNIGYGNVLAKKMNKKQPHFLSLESEPKKQLKCNQPFLMHMQNFLFFIFLYWNAVSLGLSLYLPNKFRRAHEYSKITPNYRTVKPENTL